MAQNAPPPPPPPHTIQYFAPIRSGLMSAVDHVDVIDPVDGTCILFGHILPLHLKIRYTLSKKSCPSSYSDSLYDNGQDSMNINKNIYPLFLQDTSYLNATERWGVNGTINFFGIYVNQNEKNPILSLKH